MSARTEYALIGALLVDPEAIEVVAPLVELEDFAEPRAGLVYSVVSRLYRDGKPAHFVRVCDEIERGGDLAFVGTAFLTTVAACCPSSLDAPDLAAMVARDGAERRGQSHRLPFKGAVRV